MSRNSIRLGFGFTFIIFVILAGLSYGNTVRLLTDARWVAHSYQTIEAINSLATDPHDAQNAADNYVLTRQTDYLDVYHQAIQSTQQNWQDLRTLVMDNADQLQRLDSLKPLIDQQIGTLQATVDWRDQHPTEAVPPQDLILQAGSTDKQIQSILNEMTTEELSLLETRQSQSNSSNQNWLLVFSISTVTSGVIIIGFFLSLIRESISTRRATSALQDSEARARIQYKEFPVPTYTWQRQDQEMVFVDYNYAAARLNDDLQEQLGKTARSLYEANPQIIEEMEKCYQEKIRRTWEMPYILRKNGERGYFVMTCIYLAPDRVMLHAEDITQRKRAEDDSQESRRFSQQVIDSSPNIIYIYDALTRENVYINEKTDHILGYSEAEVVTMGRTLISTLMHPDNLPGFRRHVAEVLAARDGEILEFTYRMKHKDGRWCWLYSRDTPFKRDSDGKVTQYLGTAEDITAWQEAEETLQLTQFSIDHAVDGVLWVDHESLLINVNEAACHITGYPREELLLMRMTDFMPELVMGTWQQQWNAIKQKGTWYIEGRLHTKEQRVVSVEIVAKYLNFNGTEYIFAFMRDITRRKMVEEALTQSEERYRSVISALSEGIMLCQEHSNIIACNVSAERIFGQPASYMIGKNMLLSATREDGSFFLNNSLPTLAALQTGEAQYDVEMRISRPDGTFRWISTNTQPIFNPGDARPHAVVISFSDITERRRLAHELAQARDEALEASRLKSSFLATMSHEIRTPLNGVIGMIDLLLETPLTAEQHDLGETVRSSGNTLLTLINDILDYSKIEAGRMVLESVDFEPLDLVEGVADMLALQTRQKNLSFMTFVDPAIPPMLRGDPVRLHQVLLNLTGNAIKFTQQGEIIVQANLERITETQVGIHFSVSDTGIGISESAIEKLFQPFTQADASTTRQFGGTGLGLAICKRLVELMNGTLGVESQVGMGSTFWFSVELPISPGAARLQSVLNESSDLHDLKVLVIEDNKMSKDILCRYLSDWGVVNDSVSDAEHGLNRLHQQVALGTPYDVTLIDMVMPSVDGFALAQAIQKDPALTKTHLVLITAFYRDDYAKRLDKNRVGNVAWITKPIKQPQLLKTLIEIAHPTPLTEITPAAPPVTLVQNQQRILLVEDNPTNQKVALLQLESFGCLVDTVSSGQEALDNLNRANGNAYALIFMDCQMPGMDGFETTRLIRERESTNNRSSRIPIIAMTANVLPSDRAECLAAGMDDYVAKPVTLKQLGEMLTRWLPSYVPDLVPEPPSATLIDTPDDAEPAILEPKALNEIRKLAQGAKPGFLKNLIEVFISGAADLLRQLQDGVDSQNARDVYRAAHTLKSNGATYGATRLTELCKALETQARGGDLTGAAEQVAQIRDEYAKVELAIKAAVQD